MLLQSSIQHYIKEYDFYEMASKLVAQQLETSLHEAGIRAILKEKFGEDNYTIIV